MQAVLYGPMPEQTPGIVAWALHSEQCAGVRIQFPRGGTAWADVSHSFRQEHVLGATVEKVNRPSPTGPSLGFSSMQPAGAHFMFADGQVQFRSDNIAAKGRAADGVYS